MAEHKMAVRRYGETEFIAKCATCGWQHPGRTTKRDEAEAWLRVHERELRKVRAGLEPKNPSMKSQRDYFEEMAQRDDQSAEQRRLWQQLADELTKRLGDRRSPVGGGQDGLF